MKIDGACHCGKIAFEAEIDPKNVGICHCTDCQSLSASAFRTVAKVDEADFTLMTGHPKTYIKTAESGAKRLQVFCPDCGAHIYATSDGDGPKIYGLRLGGVRQRGQLAPKFQHWTKSEMPWLSELASVPKSLKN